MTQKTAYITTPIYYPSGKPHLGSAYTSLACDIYARFKRLDGYDCKMLTGVDEHGLKIQRKAEELGKTPQEYVDEMAELFQTLSPTMNLSNDFFIRTTSDLHKQTAQKLWLKLQENGYIYKANYSGWYCVSDEAYYDESELVEGKAPSGHPVEWMEEESYFFKLSAFGDKLLAYYAANPDFIQPQSRKNEVIAFINQGLQDISISRTTFNWGVPVPGDAGHVMYVWIDALTNYISYLGWPDGEMMRYWPGIHLVGKDILRFHAIYWPAMLMGADIPCPKKVFAHGWWTSEGKKMSKSFGNVVAPEEVVEQYGQDQIRYFLMREVPFGNDGDFSKERLVERINADLANALGNLFQRVLSMVNKNCDGKVPELLELSELDSTFLNAVGEALPKVREHIDNMAFHKALEAIWSVIADANKYMDTTQPWTLKKENPAQMAHHLRVLMEAFVSIAALVTPFMPKAGEEFARQLSLGELTFAAIEPTGEKLKAGTDLPAPTGVFMRIVAGE